MKPKVSLIIAVLDSQEIVKRTLKYYSKILPEEMELIIVDDGSEPALKSDIKTDMNYKIIKTNNFEPWTQPEARNIGVKEAEADYVLLTDLDHFFSLQSLRECLTFKGDKMTFRRNWAILDEDGFIQFDMPTLREYGLPYNINTLAAGSHCNTFLMKKSVYEELGGYDKKYCGRYGGDDVDFNKRYGKLHGKGRCQRAVMARNHMYVFPDPRRDVKRVFHNLRFKK